VNIVAAPHADAGSRPFGRFRSLLVPCALCLTACSVLQPPGERAAPPDLTFRRFRVQQYRDGALANRATFNTFEYERDLGRAQGDGTVFEPVEGSAVGTTVTAVRSSASTKTGLVLLEGGVVYLSADGERAQTESATVNLASHTSSGDLPVTIVGIGHHVEAKGFDASFAGAPDLELRGGVHSLFDDSAGETALAARMAGPDARNARAIDITSDSMSVLPGTHTAAAHGHVVARSATFEAESEEGQAQYGATEAGHRRSIESMQMHGHFHMRRFSDGMIAEASDAAYDAGSSLVVLTGDPVVTRGADVLHGERIEVGTDDNQVVVQQPRVELPRRKHGEPVHVRSEQLTSMESGDHLRFEHNVQVREGNFTARSDRMDTFTEPVAGGPSQLTRLVMVGHVEAHRGNQTATAGRATYDIASTDLILEESPILTQDGDVLSGSRITNNNATGRAIAQKADVKLHEEKR
jgi:lipopolysaccharide transport protein LptA/LPS export ABC transporter protein LptC